MILSLQYRFSIVWAFCFLIRQVYFKFHQYSRIILCLQQRTESETFRQHSLSHQISLRLNRSFQTPWENQIIEQPELKNWGREKTLEKTAKTEAKERENQMEITAEIEWIRIKLIITESQKIKCCYPNEEFNWTKREESGELKNEIKIKKPLRWTPRWEDRNRDHTIPESPRLLIEINIESK